MTLLDRFRTASRDKHPDPLVRLLFVEELPLNERDTIVAIARSDDDPRVRKAAVSKLMVPSELAAIAHDDRDEGVRAQAAGMLRDIALEAFEEIGEAESLEAIAATADPRALSHIAKTATRESVALRALARVDDGHLLGSIARHAANEASRLTALKTLLTRDDHGEILGVALNSDFKDTALVAVDALSERIDLDLVIARGKNKSAVKRARTVVRDAEERVARETAEAAALAALTAAIAEPLVDSAAEQTTPPHGDPLSAPAAIPLEDPETIEARRVEDEAAAAEALRLKAEAEAERRQARLTELLDQVATAPPDEPFADARKRFNLVRKEWRDLTTGVEVEAGLLTRFTELDRAMAEREREVQDADLRARREALARLQQLLARIEAVAANPDLTLKAAERALRDVRTALSAMPQLPCRQDFDEMSGKLKERQAFLAPKVQELREADDWRRFSNVAIQEQLCAKMESLRTQEDADAIANTVRELQQEWRAAADVPRAQADLLWRRFKAAHDEVWARCEAHFAAQAQERAENLAKKITLCERAESLADSTNWIQTADEIKQLQAEWKTIGPVSRGREKAVWDRFRAACDRFFTRRHEDLAARKATWAENLAKKDALCVRAEALAESIDWDNASLELKKLQAEWRTIGPVKKSKSEAIWQRFRSASDKFFARYAHRHDTARAERIAAREAICVEAEALAALDEAPADVATSVRTLRNRWQQEIAARGVDPDQARALDQRFAAATNAVIGRWPTAFAGTDLDPLANQKRMETLVARVEALAGSLAGSAEADAAMTPSNRLAHMLKEALAANTIGGKVGDDSRLRAAAEEVRQAQAAWQRLGSVPDEVRRQLTDRFQRAVRKVTERTSAASASPEPSRSSRPAPQSSGRMDDRRKA